MIILLDKPWRYGGPRVIGSRMLHPGQYRIPRDISQELADRALKEGAATVQEVQATDFSGVEEKVVAKSRQRTHPKKRTPKLRRPKSQRRAPHDKSRGRAPEDKSALG